MHCKSSAFHPIFIRFISFTCYVCHTACFYDKSNKYLWKPSSNVSLITSDMAQPGILIQVTTKKPSTH